MAKRPGDGDRWLCRSLWTVSTLKVIIVVCTVFLHSVCLVAFRCRVILLCSLKVKKNAYKSLGIILLLLLYLLDESMHHWVIKKILIVSQSQNVYSNVLYSTVYSKCFTCIIVALQSGWRQQRRLLRNALKQPVLLVAYYAFNLSYHKKCNAF